MQARWVEDFCMRNIANRLGRAGLAQRVLAGAGVAAALSMAWSAVPIQSETAQVATQNAATTGAPGFRRLNEAQYIRSIEQIFGPEISVPGRFDPPRREDGLLAIGEGRVTVSPSGIEQYELRAREISAQVLAEDRRAAVVPCAAQVGKGFDRQCAASFLSKYGRILYRRPLADQEMGAILALAQAAASKSGSFHKGLEIGLARLLISPNFIFRVERSEADPAHPGEHRLDRYSLATRLSFLLWDAPPDEVLLDAAAAGDLHDPVKLGAQVDRLMADRRFEHGVRSFFSDMFGYEQFQGLSKDQSIYPKFTSQMAKDAQEQSLRTIIDHLVTNKGDYRDLFVTKKTFMNRNLGALYKVPVEAAGMDGWTPYVFGPEDPRGGLLTLAAFLMLDPTHEGRSSPTIRGKSVREFLLCQQVPQPPPNVDFAAVQDVHNPLHRTARQRLAIHAENPACAGCHALTDPVGLSMENYDAFGEFRTHENDALIDASGTFDGKSYKGLMEFSRLLRDSPDVPMCLVQRSFEYAAGRPVADSEAEWLETTNQAFAKDGYRFSALLRRIATSRTFAKVAAPEPAGRLAASRPAN
jgi:hypothetical protein